MTTRRSQAFIAAAALALLAAIAGIDLSMPLGHMVWSLYLLPVGLSLFLPYAWAPFMLAALASVLTAAGFMYSPNNGALHLAAVNRITATIALWGLAAVIWQAQAARRRLVRLHWLDLGETTVAQTLIGEHTPESIAANATGALCAYLDAEVGVLYRLEAGQLLRAGGHAMDDASLPQTIGLQHGLAGEVARSGQAIAIADVPRGHLAVASALGRSAPRHIVIAPVTEGGVVCGVVELGFVRAQADFDETLALLHQVGESIGVALRTALYRRQLMELLDETQRQSEELQTQQEELRVSNEELEEQSRALQESQARLELQQAELEQSNVQLEEHTQALQRQKQALLDAQSELQAHAGRLEAASRYKSEFLANMSHELRTPLNSALILSKLLADNRDETLTAEQVKYAKAIHASNNDLLALINDILDLSKIEAGHVDLTIDAVPLRAIADALHTTFEPMARQKGLGFTVELDAGVPATIVTDGQRLQQVLKNLLANAVKFTDSGEVSLRVSPAPAGRVRFDVRDTGVGVARQEQQVIFEAFCQADGSTSRRFGGTGLGLSISRELTQRLGGDIEIDSEPGRGSVFSVTLPLVLQQADVAGAAPAPAPQALPEQIVIAPSAAPPAIAPAPHGPSDDRDLRQHPGRLILAVEDDVRFASVLVDLAHEMGFDCIVAGTAREAVEQARERQPSGVLLDVGLPDASGLSVLEQLKHDPATRHIPVHMLSAHDRQRTALELGAVGYILKPATREDLRGAIEDLERRLRQSLRRVLVVEDDAELRANLGLLLGGAQTQITAVGTVADALAQLAANSFDCMVMDLTLPDGSGYDLLEKMAQGEGYAFPPVIVYTGRALTREEEHRLRRYSKSIIIKGARSPERLLDEVTLFLHSVEASLPSAQQRLLRQARRRDAVLDGRRILLAEDDVRNIFALSSVFEPLGARLEIARNGREALERLEDGDIDLVLMDIMMPEMDGLTAMRHIRQRPAWAQLPIIALTAKAMPDDRERCLEAGANDYIAKPIDVDKLISLARVWCPK